MKKVLFLLLLVAVAFALYWFKFRPNDDVPSGPKQQPITVKSHSQGFDKNVDSLLDGYAGIKDALVDADSVKAKAAAGTMAVLLSRLNMDELKKDTTGIYETAATFLTDIKTNVESIKAAATLTEMRHDFADLSENLYPLLKTVHYKGKTLYWQNCSMPFGDNSSANWISSSAEIVNPYLGNKHPVYKSGMLHCGETQDSIIAK